MTQTDHEALRLGRPLMARLAGLAAFGVSPGLTRLYLTQSHRQAALQVAEWMRDAGMTAGIDAIGNVVGRTPGAGPRVMLGSHIDTVRDAGRYDGAFGVLAAIAAVAELLAHGALPVPVEIVAFGDEEGVRFPTTMSGSRALAGAFDRATLSASDADGVVFREALISFGGDPDAIGALSREEHPPLAYIEAHIEQGPVLEAQNLPLGIVTAIAGATRLRATVTGTAGHAGTVPMSMRHDALVAASGMVMAIEAVASARRGLVATVGQMAVRPGAPNSIPGEVAFTIDIRAGDDSVRTEGVDALRFALGRVASERGVTVRIETTHEAAAVACAEGLQAGIAAAIESLGIPAMHLPSGAGHDAMMMARICPIGMIFTRCWRGISHNPAEAVSEVDAGLTVLAMSALLRNFVL